MTLAETVKTFRVGARLILIGAGLLLFGRIALAITGSALPGPRPTPTPTPPAGFGKLPPLEIDFLALDTSATPTAVLDLISAVLPEAPQTIPVYSIAESSARFLLEEKANTIASRFGLTGSPEISNTHYIWRSNQHYLAIDKTTLNIDYQYDYHTAPELFTPGVFFSTSKITDIGRKVLEQKKLDYGLEESKPRYQLLKFQDGELRQASNLRDTSAVKINFSLPSQDQYPIVEQDPQNAQISVVFTGNLRDRDSYGTILELQSVRWTVLHEKLSSYPVKSSSQAWEEFINTKKYIVQLSPRGWDSTLPVSPQRVTEFRAREVFLAYFNPLTYQKYLQPVWVFKGNAVLLNLQLADWQAYIPAIPDEWIEQGE